MIVMRTLSLALALLAAASLPVRAGDAEAGLKAGGLVLEPGSAITVAAEELTLSEQGVRAAYRFRNPTGADIEATLTFPMPDLNGASTTEDSIPIRGRPISSPSTRRSMANPSRGNWSSRRFRCATASRSRSPTSSGAWGSP